MLKWAFRVVLLNAISINETEADRVPFGTPVSSDSRYAPDSLRGAISITPAIMQASAITQALVAAGHTGILLFILRSQYVWSYLLRSQFRLHGVGQGCVCGAVRRLTH